MSSETNEVMNMDGGARNTTSPDKPKLDESLFLLSKNSEVGDTIISKEDAAKMEKIINETQVSTPSHGVKLALDMLVDITNSILLTYKDTINVEEKYKRLMREGLDMLYTSTLSSIKKEIDQLLLMYIPPHKGFVEHPENIKEVHAPITAKPISVPVPIPENPIPQPKMSRTTRAKLNKLAKMHNKFFDKLVGKADPEKSETPKTGAEGKKTSKGKSKKAK